MSSNSVSNHTRGKQIRLPLRGRPILLITRMITDRVGLLSVLLSLLIGQQGNRNVTDQLKKNIAKTTGILD